MENSALQSISPVDGRYQDKTKDLQKYFSESALIRYRVMVEVEYFIALCELPLPQLNEVNHGLFQEIRELYIKFTLNDALEVKEFEKTTNHDVKAVEYFLKAKFDEIGLSEYKEFIHFGLTSQDVNNTAVPASMKDAHGEVIFPAIGEVIIKLTELANGWDKIPMLARTHGQPASPTRLGKEIRVFIDRLKKQAELLKVISFSGKFGGATGNFNAHHVAYPEINWVDFGNRFLEEKLKLARQQVTTQIEHYDCMAAYFDNLKRINNILIDLDRDIWTYVSMDYFKQKIKAGEVGSSAMPHKVNPIDFENSEGNLGYANAIFEHLSAKLPISRLQRDLTDSTVTRNIGVPLAHMLIGIKSLLKGLGKLLLNEDKLYADLEANWAVVAEAIQTILRKEGYPNPYEALKDLTRTNEKINKQAIQTFIEGLTVPVEVKERLLSISPFNYTGI